MIIPNTAAYRSIKLDALYLLIHVANSYGRLQAQSRDVTSNPPNSQMDVDEIKQSQAPDAAQDVPGTAKEKPPPVPPRPTNKAKIEEYAMQQDVQEVMGNVIHQLQWAISPERITKNGNQEDVISE